MKDDLFIAIDEGALLQDDLTGRIRNVHGQLVVDDAINDGEFLTEFVTTGFGQVVTTVVEELGFHQVLGAFFGGDFIGPLVVVDVVKGFTRGAHFIRQQGVDQVRVVPEERGKHQQVVVDEFALIAEDVLTGRVVTQGVEELAERGRIVGVFGFFRIKGKADRFEEDRGKDFAFTVDGDVDLEVRLGEIAFRAFGCGRGFLEGGDKFEPGSTGRNQFAVVFVLLIADLVFEGRVVVISSGGTNDLRDDDAFGTVNNKGPGVGHQREFAQEDVFVLLGDFTGGGIEDFELHVRFERRSVVGFAFFAFSHGILGFLEFEGDEVEADIFPVVNDRVNFLEDFFDAFLGKPIKGIGLNFYEVG